MRKYLLLFLIILLAPAQAHAFGGHTLGAGVAAAAGPTCSGDFSSGQNESFEAGAGSFCTTDLAETDAAGAISTYDTGWYFCGSHSMSIIHDANSPGNIVRINLGSADADFYLRYYLKYAAAPAYALVSYMPRFGNASDASMSVVVLVNTGESRHELKFRQVGCASAYSTEYFAITDGGEYRVEVHVVGSAGTTTMKLYKKNGASWDAVLSSTGGADYEIDIAACQADHQYIDFISNSNSETGVTFYYDDIKVALSGADYIGSDTCE